MPTCCILTAEILMCPEFVGWVWSCQAYAFLVSTGLSGQRQLGVKSVSFCLELLLNLIFTGQLSPKFYGSISCLGEKVEKQLSIKSLSKPFWCYWTPFLPEDPKTLQFYFKSQRDLSQGKLMLPQRALKQMYVSPCNLS